MLFKPLARSRSYWPVLPQMFVSSSIKYSSNHVLTTPGTTFLALSLRAAGYSVWANIEASGTTTPLIRDVSNQRMQAAGVQLVSLFSIVCDLMRDWRNTPGALQLLPWLDMYYPAYGYVARAHAAAIANGTLQPGEAGLI